MNQQIPLWGSLTISSVWIAAPGSEPFDIIMGVVWFLFAAAVLFFGNLSRTSEE